MGVAWTVNNREGATKMEYLLEIFGPGNQTIKAFTAPVPFLAIRVGDLLTPGNGAPKPNGLYSVSSTSSTRYLKTRAPESTRQEELPTGSLSTQKAYPIRQKRGASPVRAVHTVDYGAKNEFLKAYGKGNERPSRRKSGRRE
jgi:hypothetical protein